MTLQKRKAISVFDTGRPIYKPLCGIISSKEINQILDIRRLTVELTLRRNDKIDFSKVDSQTDKTNYEAVVPIWYRHMK